MFKSSIYNQVIKVLKQRIAEVQKVHDLQIGDEIVNHATRVAILRHEHENRKREITAKHLDSILGKIL